MATAGDGGFVIWLRVVRAFVCWLRFRLALRAGAGALSFLLQYRLKSGEYSLTVRDRFKDVLVCSASSEHRLRRKNVGIASRCYKVCRVSCG